MHEVQLIIFYLKFDISVLFSWRHKKYASLEILFKSKIIKKSKITFHSVKTSFLTKCNFINTDINQRENRNNLITTV